MSEVARPQESKDIWLTPRRFAALLALLTLASYPQVFLGFQTFVFRDFGYFAYPIAYHLRESFWRGEIPLWNPLNDCGTPFLAQWNTQVLYPPALFYLLLPLSWSLGVFCLLHLFWGGLGMFLLARHWTQNRFAAAFAGVVFAFNGLMLNSLMWPATVTALGWDAVGDLAHGAGVARRRTNARHRRPCQRAANALGRDGSCAADLGVAGRAGAG